MCTEFKFDGFDLKSPPRTGRMWFCRAAAMVGLGEGDVTAPMIENLFSVCIVRHPVTWLESVYEKTLLMPECPDSLVLLQKIARNTRDFQHFMGEIPKYPGIVEEAFQNHDTVTAIRLEDFPYSAMSIFETAGVPEDVVKMVMVAPKLNYRMWRKTVDHDQYRAIVKSEKNFCEKYDYF